MTILEQISCVVAAVAGFGLVLELLMLMALDLRPSRGRTLVVCVAVYIGEHHRAIRYAGGVI